MSVPIHPPDPKKYLLVPISDDLQRQLNRTFALVFYRKVSGKEAANLAAADRAELAKLGYPMHAFARTTEDNRYALFYRDKLAGVTGSKA